MEDTTIATWTFEVRHTAYPEYKVYVNWSVEPGPASDDDAICGTTDGTLPVALQAAYDAAGIVFPFVEDADLVALYSGPEEDG